MKPQKFATIAIIGLPNAGKSTLLNTILQQKIAAVHRKPQMTRKNLLGIHTHENCQLIFVDTPGIHSSKEMLNLELKKQWKDAIQNADLLLLLFDVTQPLSPVMIDFLQRFPVTKRVVVFNKTELSPHKWLFSWNDIGQNQSDIFFISAKTGQGVPELLNFLTEQAPEHPFLYDEDNITVSSCREITRDLIQEKLMEFLHHEIPYQTTVLIESYVESPKHHEIHANIIVNKESQKGMIIGQGGQMLKKIRENSEKEISLFIGLRVKLHLFVKVDKNWISSAQKMKEYGF